MVRSRDITLIVALVGGLLSAVSLTLLSSTLRLQDVSVAAVVVLLARALFLVLLGATAFRCWEVRQNRVLLGGRDTVSGAQPDRRSRVHSAPEQEQRGKTAAEPCAAASDSAAATAAADTSIPEEPNPPAAVLQQSTSTALASREDVLPSSSDVHADLHHLTGSPEQPRVPSPQAVQSTQSAAAAESPADARADSYDGGAAAAVSTSGRRLAVHGSASDSSSTDPHPSVESEAPASVQQQLSDNTPATAAAANDPDDGMAPKTLQEARAKMLRRQETAKARHAEEQRAERQAQRRRRLDEAEARLEAWRAAQRAAEVAEEASWSQLTAQRRAEEARRQLLQEQDAEYQQALQRDAEAAEEQRRELDAQQEAADARRLAAERAWSDCAQVAAMAAARLSRCPEPRSDGPTAATLSLRLPNHPVQRRRFSTSAMVADVYAWAQLALLQGICPTMDVQLQRLLQHAPDAVAADRIEAPGGDDGSGSGAAAAGVASLHLSRGRTDVPQSESALPPGVGEDWVQRWADGEASGGGSSWAWRGGWRLVQTYPRRPLPCEHTTAGGDGTVGGAGLAPQAALAVEQLEDHGST